MTTIRFTIGTAFPAANPVARFVTVLAMMSNDWLRLTEMVTKSFDEGDDPESLTRRFLLFRQQVALHHEAVKRLQDAPRQFGEIADFMAGLGPEAKADHDIIVAALDPASDIGKWLKAHRGTTFHYPEVQRDKAAAGQEELYTALDQTADAESTIVFVTETLKTVRFYFADEVAVQWLPDVETVSGSARTAIALTRYVQRAMGAYLRSLPPGSYTIERD